MSGLGWCIAVSHTLVICDVFHKGLFKININVPLMLKILIISKSHVENSWGAMKW